MFFEFNSNIELEEFEQSRAVEFNNKIATVRPTSDIIIIAVVKLLLQKLYLKFGISKESPDIPSQFDQPFAWSS